MTILNWNGSIAPPRMNLKTGLAVWCITRFCIWDWSWKCTSKSFEKFHHTFLGSKLSGCKFQWNNFTSYWTQPQIKLSSFRSSNFLSNIPTKKNEFKIIAIANDSFTTWTSWSWRTRRSANWFSTFNTESISKFPI